MTDQTKPMDAERIAEIRAREKAATPGPWWESDNKYGRILADIPGWPDANAPEDEFHGTDAGTTTVAESGGPDATFIAASRQDIPDLLAEVARLSAERDAALLDVARMKDTQKDMGSLDDVLEAIMRRYPDDPYADYLTSRLEESVQPREIELFRLRAVVEEAREWGNHNLLPIGSYANTNYASELAAILDRGLKGAGE